MKSKMIMPQEVFRVIVDDCRYKNHNGHLCVEWTLRILDGDWTAKTLTKYNNLNGPAAAALFREELRLLDVPFTTPAEFENAPSRLIGKQCYVRYGMNDSGYFQTEIDFERTSGVHIKEKIKETWRRYYEQKENNNL